MSHTFIPQWQYAKAMANACLLSTALLTQTAQAENPAKNSSSVNSSSIHSSSAYVIVDQSEKGFVVFTGLAHNTPPAKLANFRKKVNARDGVSMVTWSEFVKNLDGYAKATILVDDYPQVDAVDGMLCLMSKKITLGAPWGLTWNGGIAFTYRDYQHTRRNYKKYLKNPAAYQATTDPRRDPIYPNHHLRFAGCQR